jgi:hypothetical protein
MELKDQVREKYGLAALCVKTGGSSCCGASAGLDGCCDPITSNPRPESAHEAITVMRELGIDISGQRSKGADEFAGQSFDYVLTLCFEDLAARDGREEERLAVFAASVTGCGAICAGFPPLKNQPVRYRTSFAKILVPGYTRGEPASL